MPEWSIPYLKDGNEYGLTAEQLKTVKDFEKDFPSKLSIEITESSIEGNHNTELGPATTVDKAKIYYFEQHISDIFPTDESTRDRLDKDLSEDNKNRKTLSDLQAQHSNIKAQYPAAVNDERTRQLAMRINQASQIISEYSNNIKAVYGQDFMFSEAANKVMIPQSIYSGQLKPLSVVQDQGANQEKKVSVPDSLQVPVWEAYEKEKSQTGDFTYQDTAEEYGNILLKGVENILPRIKGTLTIDQWGSDVLSAKIENDPRIFDTYIIPEPLKAWLEVSPKEESHSNMQGSSTGKNVDIVAAYVFSTILLQKENQEVGLSFTIDGKQWDNYNEVMQGKSDHSISDEAFAAAWALQSSMGISKHDLSKNAVAVLKDHIDTTEYYGEPTLNGSKGGIELLQSGKVSADYSVKGQQVTVEASPKIEEELHTEQEKNISVPESLQVPVWEAYEKEKSQTGDFTYQDTAEEYGNILLKGVENILPRIKGTLTIDQWGSDVLSAKIENDPRIFDTYIIPEPLKAWLEVSPKEESHSNMQGSSTGKNVDIVAAYVFSTILLQKENQEVGLSFTIDGKQWDNYNEVMQGKSDHSISDEAFAAAWALQSSMGISKHDLSKNAVAVLKDHIDTTEYYGEPTLNGSKGGIELLQSGKVSADYSVKGQQVTVEASPKIEEELHTEQEKNISVPESLQVPVWEAYEKEKGNPGENTYQNTVDDYTKKLIAGVEDILPNVDAVVNVNEKGEKSLAINLWHNPYRTIVASYIPEPLEKWLDLTTVKEPVANSKDKWLLSGHIEGDKHLYNNSQIVAAYMVSDLLSGKERDFLSLPMSYSNGDKQYTEEFRKDSSITREENAAFIAIEESKGINQEYLIPSAITNLERKIKNDRYHLEGSEGAIDLLKSGQISAAYTEILSKSENLDNASKVEESIEETSLSEDSNPETNVASIAKNIMEKGNVPKEVAEKQATVIADAQQVAIEEKKQKAEQAKQAALKKAEDERRREVEEEKRREEENKQQEKDSGPSSKLLLHAALLLGALELAKGNKGIWMNKAGKSNAEFIGAKRPIMAYNNIMMNLQSDRQGYRSNVYTTYESAKDAGTAVKQNEESLAFNWVKWDYQHVGTKELISREDYDKLPAEEKEFYTKHKSKEEYGIFNIDQTTMPAGKQADYTALLKDKGAKIDQLSERGVSSMMKFAEKLKSNHPTSMVIARTDSKYQIYGKDASRAGKLLNLPVSQTEENGQKVKSVSFPLDRINDYLPKLVEAKQWVVVAENLDSAELIRQLPNEKEVISNANQTAQRVAKSAGIGYERVMVLQDAAYDKQADKIIVSGMSDKDAGDSRQAALQKANDIYRAVVAATGSEHRLDRMGRNNLLPVDDAKYERFVQDLAAGVLMARQGLPATLSKESMQNVNYLQREIRENPKMLGLIEKDVNNAIGSIDKHLKQEIVKYEDIRKELTPKDLIVSPKQYKISSDLAKIPDIESKQIVIVRDKAKGAADVILPEGASLDDDVEISGIRKDRIKIALGKEGISDVKFYNAGGGLGLNETNDYYKGKEVSVDKLKQYDFSQHRDIDVKPQIEAAKVANIKLFTPIRDDKGQYAFFFKVDNEPSFAVYPNEAHKRAYFDARNTEQKKEIHEALAQKYYSVAQKHPEIKVDLIMPKVPAVDMSKIERPTITKDRDDPNKKYVMATIDGKLMKEPISKDQWNKMWLADDMAEYKKAVAAVTFAPFLKVEEKNENPIKQEKQENVSSNQEQTLSQSEDTNEEDVQQEETTPRTVKPRGMGIG